MTLIVAIIAAACSSKPKTYDAKRVDEAITAARGTNVSQEAYKTLIEELEITINEYEMIFDKLAVAKTDAEREELKTKYEATSQSMANQLPDMLNILAMANLDEANKEAYDKVQDKIQQVVMKMMGLAGMQAAQEQQMMDADSSGVVAPAPGVNLDNMMAPETNTGRAPSLGN